jgi:S-adenosylmethionine:tRNA ribosyltransferase-isomerase
MHPALLQIKDYTYELPDEKIASYPLPARDGSKLLICRNNYITEDVYRHLSKHLPQQSLLVFNQTKVVHARLLFRKETGARIEIFCLEPDERYSDIQTAMLQKGTVYWKCMVGGAAKWKEDQVIHLHTKGETPQQGLSMSAALIEKKEGVFILRLDWNNDITFAEALQEAGQVPLPPYLNRQPEQSDEHRYQTIFAREEGSVAAPTAALHFTENILEDLAGKQISTAFVTLHVGAGTFKPVKAATMQGHDMHAEWIEVTPGLIRQLIQQLGGTAPVIAVGTTSARTLESLYWIGVRMSRNEMINTEGIAVPQWYPYEAPSALPAAEALEAILLYLEQKGLPRLITRTQIIIAPGYTYKIIKGLITNFHQPQSTLLLLVAALIGDTWRKVYRYALEHDFRFLSYGDGCLLWAGEQKVT